jgi:hypothetical protein
MVGSDLTFRKSFVNKENLPGERSADTVGIAFPLAESFFLLRSAGPAILEIIQNTAARKRPMKRGKKSFGFRYENEESERHNDCNNRIVPCKGINAVYPF